MNASIVFLILLAATIAAVETFIFSRVSWGVGYLALFLAISTVLVGIYVLAGAPA